MTRLVKFIFSLLVISSFLHFNGFSQVEVRKSENKVVIEGIIYFLHVVKPGQTLYSVSRAYGLSEKAIALENPGVYSGLQVGQVLKIPSEVPQVEKTLSSQDSAAFISYPIKPGETIFSLSKRFNVSVEEIEKVNPLLDVTDIAVGQVILIPKLQTVESAQEFDLHKVRRKENLYRLAKKYGISEEAIIEYNPSVKWGHLRTGQVLRIPRKEYLLKKDEFVAEEIPVDTTQSFSEESDISIGIRDSLGLQEMSLEDYFFHIKNFNRRELNIAYLIPFNYREEEIIPDSTRDENSDDGSEEEKPEIELPQSVNFLEFFQGSLLALDSLKKEGLTLNIEYFDTYRSPSKVREILRDPFFRDVDLIIGPFYAYNLEIIAEFSRDRKVPVISPFYDGCDLTGLSPFMFQITPSFRTEYNLASEILARDYDKNFVFIYKKDSSKFHEIDYFKASLLKGMRAYTHTENVVIKEICYENSAKAKLSDDLSHTLSRDRQNIVVIPESSEAFVKPVITQLFFQLRNFDIEVWGLPGFHEFNSIEFEYYHNLKLRYLSPFYYDYHDPDIAYFLKKYADTYYSEPRFYTRKGCSYAFAGFDISYFFIHRIAEDGRRFVSGINDNRTNMLLPDFSFSRPSPYGGFENKAHKLVQFTNDFDILAKDPEEAERTEYDKPQWFE